MNVSSPDPGAQPQWELFHYLQHCQKLPSWSLLGLKEDMELNGEDLLTTLKTLSSTPRWSQGRINKITLMKKLEPERDEQGEEGPERPEY